MVADRRDRPGEVGTGTIEVRLTGEVEGGGAQAVQGDAEGEVVATERTAACLKPAQSDGVGGKAAEGGCGLFGAIQPFVMPLSASGLGVERMVEIPSAGEVEGCRL
jgi:hypothetical protein